MDSNILVSVNVVTYNSSKTVLETLESIKSQTYERLELIVTDDHSKDDTVQVCQKWIAENQNRFVRAKLVTSDFTNTSLRRMGSARLMPSRLVQRLNAT